MLRAPKSGLFVVKSAPRGMRSKRALFRTGERIPESGLYRVIHRQHLLPHEVTLLRDQEFPRCEGCRRAVQFQLVRAVRFTEVRHDFSMRIHLYELPVLEQEQSEQIAV